MNSVYFSELGLNDVLGIQKGVLTLIQYGAAPTIPYRLSPPSFRATGQTIVSHEHASTTTSTDILAVGSPPSVKSKGIQVGQFLRPSSMTIDRLGNIYMITYDNCISILSPGDVHFVQYAGLCDWNGFRDGPYQPIGGQIAAGGLLGDQATFNGPLGLSVDDSFNLYVADTGNNAIRKILWFPNASVAGEAGTVNVTTFAVGFLAPQGVAWDGADGVYVADTGNHVIKHVDGGGVVTSIAGTGKRGAADGVGAQFDTPIALAYRKGVLYVGDANGIRTLAAAGGGLRGA
jgi:hypothetical protein